MNDILFLNPPYFPRFSRAQRSPAVTRSGTLYYPMWLAYAAAWAERHGFLVDLIDAPADGLDLEGVIKRINGDSPDLIVIDTSTPSIYNDLKIGDHLKQKYPGSFILMVGTHTSALPHESIKESNCVDAVAIGEYDNTVLHLIRNIKKKEPQEKWQIPGLLLRSHDETFVPLPFDRNDDLDGIPPVTGIYRKFLDVNSYFNPNALFPMVAIVTGRGCRYRCSFCVYPQVFSGKGQRLRSVENILEEFQFVKSHLPGVKAVFMEDDTFTANVDRCREVCKALIGEIRNISWTANARADVDLETMRLMKQAGCRTLCVGFESGDQGILDAMGKKITIDRMNTFAEDAKKAGLLIHGCFLYGVPGETWETMQNTLSLALKLNIDTAQFYPLMVYPGTAAYNWYSEHGHLTTRDFTRWLTPEGLHNCVIKTDQLSSRDLVQFCDYSRKKFYMRPGYILRKCMQIIRHPSEFKRKWKSAKSLLPHLKRAAGKLSQ